MNTLDNLSIKVMSKKKIHVFEKDAYLLGVDAGGEKYYLEQARFECGWYWGFGYVETYTNKRNPEKSRDISSHQHFDGLFFREYNGFDNFKNMFVNTPFSDSEIWKICELMKSFYIARNYSDMLHCGGAHYTTNSAKETIKNVEEYNRINNVVIPEITKELYKILCD